MSAVLTCPECADAVPAERLVDEDGERLFGCCACGMAFVEHDFANSPQPWCASHRADPAAKRLADRHYNRQKPESAQFVPPGSCAVFLTADARAFWITSAPLAEFTKHAWAGAWVCTAFRSEGAGRASELIRMAVAATLAHYGAPPTLGMVTFIDRSEVRPIMVRGVPTWGWTWRKAGFVDAGETKGGLLALQLLPSAMPEPLAALPRSMRGAPLFDFVGPSSSRADVTDAAPGEVAASPSFA